MKLIEYDPSLSPSEWKIGESYIFIRSMSELYDKDIYKAMGQTITRNKSSFFEPGVTKKEGSPVGGVKKKIENGNDEGGVRKKETTEAKVVAEDFEPGVTQKEDAPVGGVKKKIENGNNEGGVRKKEAIEANAVAEKIEGGVTLKTKAAASAEASIDIVANDIVAISGTPTAIKYARFVKQVGRVVNKEPKADGSTYLYVEFETSSGTIGRKYQCPMDPSMYYTIDKHIISGGKKIEL